MTVQSIVTIGDIAQAIRPRREHYVRRALQRMNIKPLRCVGTTYIYAAEAVEQVREHLRERGELRDECND